MTTSINDVLVSWVRTVVPVAVGAVLTWLTDGFGLELSDEGQVALISGITGLAASLYYMIARLAEEKIPSIGWLLGVAKTPTYVEPVDPPVGH